MVYFSFRHFNLPPSQNPFTDRDYLLYKEIFDKSDLADPWLLGIRPTTLFWNDPDDHRGVGGSWKDSDNEDTQWRKILDKTRVKLWPTVTPPKKEGVSTLTSLPSNSFLLFPPSKLPFCCQIFVSSQKFTCYLDLRLKTVSHIFCLKAFTQTPLNHICI